MKPGINTLPYPYDGIEYKNARKILGKNDKHATKAKSAHRAPATKSETNMGGNKKKLFLNQTLYQKTRVMLRNALIRSTLTYALHTQEYTDQEIKTADQCQNKFPRQIKDGKWFLQDKNRPGKSATNNPNMATKNSHNATSQTNNKGYQYTYT